MTRPPSREQILDRILLYLSKLHDDELLHFAWMVQDEEWLQETVWQECSMRGRGFHHILNNQTLTYVTVPPSYAFTSMSGTEALQRKAILDDAKARMLEALKKRIEQHKKVPLMGYTPSFIQELEVLISAISGNGYLINSGFDKVFDP